MRKNLDPSTYRVTGANPNGPVPGSGSASAKKKAMDSMSMKSSKKKLSGLASNLTKVAPTKVRTSAEDTTSINPVFSKSSLMKNFGAK